jgi:NADPH-dependent F420 reductase
MKLAIIGSGNVGKALAASARRAGHDVILSARTPGHAEEAARTVGAQAAADNAIAVRDADLIILAVPYAAVVDVAADIGAHVAGRTVIDVTNPLKADYSGPALEGTSAAEEIQRLLPGARIAKAFNAVLASRMAAPNRDLDAFVAADDPQAKQETLALVDSLGFSPLDVGPLSAARSLEAMAWLNISLNLANGWDWTSAWKLVR